MTSNITAIILAGGKSSRMKRDKAFLRLSSKAIIEELISRLKKRFSNLIIITNDIVKYAQFGIEVAGDIVPEKGPLGGIYTGLIKSDTLYNFVFACDIPFVNPDLIDYMVGRVKDRDIIVPRWQDRLEPLHAIYSKRCVNPIEVQLKKNDLKIRDLFPYVNVSIVEHEELEKFTSDGKPFVNINTREDYDTAVKIAC